MAEHPDLAKLNIIFDGVKAVFVANKIRGEQVSFHQKCLLCLVKRFEY